MNLERSAFSFVNRITSVSEGKRIRGSCAIPSQVGSFPLSLVGEAVGQLAAWAAMAAVDFQQRPVAGLAGSVELLAEPRPGAVLDLSADLENVDAESVEYSGTASVDGKPVIRLKDCVGPMMTLAEFDDPEKLRMRYAELCRNGAVPGGFPGLPELRFERTGGRDERSASATFKVPCEAPFFADHFPRRPVFPGSLLIYVSLQLAGELAGEIPLPAAGRWVPGTIQDMKLRSFIPPGETLLLEAKLKQHSKESASLAIQARSSKEVVGTAGLLLKMEDGA